MPYFPMFIDLKKQPVLIVGGGEVALRKTQKLMSYEADITIVAPQILPSLENMTGIICRKREFTAEDLNIHPVMVIVATDNPERNLEISNLCKEYRIPVNVADDIEKCSFLFPAVVHQGELSAGFCTGGASPTAAAYFKNRFSEILPDNIDEILVWLESKRSELKEKIPTQEKRAAVFRNLFDACIKNGKPLSDEELNTIGRVSLVGAGCGKADLITVRGLRLLQKCDAVVYDDLIDPELLNETPESALRIYMGKRNGVHSATQLQISQKLIELARNGMNVVRLKGGDPYLFGRGGEEMKALKDAGIPCFEVPGISSAIGIPAEAGIPVTHRGMSQGLHIVTAHTADTKDGLPSNFDILAQLPGTLVFLMGLQQLPEIATRLIANGKSKDTPAAVISGGNSLNPSRLRAKLSQIAQAAREADILPPAVIIVGEVASLDLNYEKKPLSGIKIGVTGTKEIAMKQKIVLDSLGANVSWLSRTVIKDKNTKIDLQMLNKKPCWAVFTSANGVRAFFRQVKENNIDLENIKFAVIGSATKKTLAQYGVKSSLCPKDFTSEALANALVSTVRPEEEVILLRSSLGSPVLSEILSKAGLKIHDVPLYDLESVNMETESPEHMDYLTFSSASGVAFFFHTYKNIPSHTKCVCIGKITAAELQKYTKNKIIIAKEALTEGIIEAILKDYND